MHEGDKTLEPRLFVRDAPLSAMLSRDDFGKNRTCDADGDLEGVKGTRIVDADSKHEFMAFEPGLLTEQGPRALIFTHLVAVIDSTGLLSGGESSLDRGLK